MVSWLNNLIEQIKDFFEVSIVIFVLGIGGFIHKPRQQRAPAKPVVQGPVTADGQAPVLLTSSSVNNADPEATNDSTDQNVPQKKKARKIRKKGIIEDTYPIYLQVNTEQ